MEDIKVEYTPYLTHYYHILKNASYPDQESQASPSFNEAAQKIREHWHLKEAEIEAEILERHQVSAEKFRVSVQYYSDYTSSRNAQLSKSGDNQEAAKGTEEVSPDD